MPMRNTLRQAFPTSASLSEQRLQQVLHDTLSAIEGIIIDKETLKDSVSFSLTLFVIHAEEDTWSRKARRRRGDNPKQHDTPMSASATWKRDTDHANDQHLLEFQWIQGRDRQLFESLCSHVGRKVGLLLKI